MKRYVCGFYFDHLLEQVVLIWKNKPDWQKGKLNGVGGKIEEGEIPIEAMIREFKEETGIQHEQWGELITLTGTDWQVVFFCAIGNAEEFEYARTMEEEEIAKIPVDDLDKYDHIPNLRWLIPMAINRLEYPEEVPSFSESSPPASREEEWVEVEDNEKLRESFDGTAIFLVHVVNSKTKNEYWNIISGYIGEESGDLYNSSDDEYAGWSYKDVSYYKPVINLPPLPAPPQVKQVS